MHLRIIGEPEKVSGILKSNRPFTLGQKITGREKDLKSYASRYPHIFALVDESKLLEENKSEAPAQVKSEEKAEDQEDSFGFPKDKDSKPEKNKMLKKSSRLKFK